MDTRIKTPGMYRKGVASEASARMQNGDLSFVDWFAYIFAHIIAHFGMVNTRRIAGGYCILSQSTPHRVPVL